MRIQINKPILIALEGIDKVGKSHQANMLRLWLGDQEGIFDTSDDSRIPLGIIHDPGGNGEGATDIISRIIHDDAFSDLERCLLLAAGRNYNIRQYLDRPGIWILDRFVASNLAYQSTCSDQIKILCNMIYAKKPDITFLLDADPSELTDRHHSYYNYLDRFEKDMEIQKRARHNFLIIMKEEYPDAHYVLDARLPAIEIHKYIKQVVNDTLFDSSLDLSAGPFFT